ncbi:MAG: formimidoylglutamate deiminase [Gammaproteobacteria bacterium]
MGELRFQHILLPEGLKRHRRVVFDDGGRITAVERCAAEGPFDGWLALPGMPNAHSHAFQRALVGQGERAAGEDSFWSWREAMYGLAAAVTPEDLEIIARRAYREMLAAGFTSVAEFHYLHHGVDGSRGSECAAAVMEAARAAGIRLALVPVLYARGGFGEPPGPRQSRFVHDTLDEFIAYAGGLPEAPAGLGAHSLRAVPPEWLTDLAAVAGTICGSQAPIHIHVAEQPGEVEACREATGLTPVQCLAEAVELDSRWVLIHGTHADAAEQATLAGSGATLVICPLTEAYLGDGLFPAAEFAGAGGRLALGSDSNVRIDAVAELRWLEYGQRLLTGRRACFADDRGLGAALWSRLAGGGSAPLGLAVGSIATGHFADLVSVDPGASILEGVAGAQGALDALVTSGDRGCLKRTWVGGAEAVPFGEPGYGGVARRLAGGSRSGP